MSATDTESRKWWALAAVSLAAFMGYLDNNIVNVAIPTIQHSLHLSESGLEWVVSSYLLTMSGLLLAGGRLADVFGRRRLFLTGIALFTLSSLAAGLAGSGGALIASRAVQGVGAAMMLPTTLAIIMATFGDARQRNTAVGIWAAVGALALALGPVLGGLISQHLRWGWIFLINVPVGVITFAIAARSVAESRAELPAGSQPATAGSRSATRLDWPGVIASAVALFALTYALIEGSSKGWTSALILGSFGLAAAAAAIFGAIETRAAQPMVQLRMFRSREFSGGTGTTMIWAFGVLGIYFFTSLYLQETLGFSPVKAGLAFVPMALCVAVFAALAPRIEGVFGAHRTVAAGMALMVIGLALFARLGLHTGYVSLLPGFMLFGAGAGMMNVPLTNAVMNTVPTEAAGVASALMNASREVAGLLGITVIGAVLSSRQSSALRGGADPLHAFLDGYHTGLWVTIGLMAAGVAVSYLSLRPRKGAIANEIPAEVAAAERLASELVIPE